MNANAVIVDGEENTDYQEGAGALLVPADDIEGFTTAIKWLLLE